MKVAGWLAGALLLLGAAWSVGFAAFLGLAQLVEEPPPRADGIVVLTGGADRVAAGLRLLGEGRAPALLISGVPQGSDLGAVARGDGLDTQGLADRVAIGHQAQTTQGNAAETATWARQRDARSLIVVTAGYHMPRALLELGRVLPGVALHPAPVRSPVLRAAANPGALRLLAGEFDKWIGARLGFHQAAPGHGT